ncbi:hypothetical protein L916_12855 [Phytophthora nicotianae]|uniref:Uncharacterized protein n=1 Tax=Phytophthora nicotianae TaxID=4792 RepID=W2INJ1_PHYNI|nr:hypothetical protein L916_12855 [Phytophthora nicotianae]
MDPTEPAQSGYEKYQSSQTMITTSLETELIHE